MTTSHAATHRLAAAPCLTSGQLLMAITVLHTLVAVGLGVPSLAPRALGGRKLLAAVLAEGAVATDPWRLAVFWSLFFGLPTMLAGWLLHRLERAGQAVPRGVLHALGALALAGGLLVPSSGFWLVLPVAFRMGWRR